jgi:hypothetical protein
MEPPSRGRAHLTQDDLGERANHHAFLSLLSWEIAAFLHDTAQTEQTPPGPEEPEGPGTGAQSRQGAAQEEREDLSTPRGGKATHRSDNAGPPREHPGASRRGRRVPFARRRNSPQPGSWSVLPEMQHTVLFVLGLNGSINYRWSN